MPAEGRTGLAGESFVNAHPPDGIVTAPPREVERSAAPGFERLAGILAARHGQAAAKRLFDMTTALLLLALLLPLFTVVALAIKLSSTGPVFFWQTREGRGGRNFAMLKFRSMRVEPAGLLPARHNELAAQGKLLKLRRDPRVTAVGRWLRRTSLDELPQLWNVLRGDMSLVGPRPLIPFMLEAHPEFRRIRALVRPGITGLWQLRDRSNNTAASAMMRHDLEYLEHFGAKQDLLILARTIPAVWAGEGAF